MEQHSAEWLRGEVAALRRLKPEVWNEPRRAMSMRDLRWCVDDDYQRAVDLLAAAEAREAEEVDVSDHDALMKRIGAAEQTRKLAKRAVEAEMKFISAEWMLAEADRLMEGE